MDSVSKSISDVRPPSRRTIGCVSFLNARPLIEGLDDTADLHIQYDVPSGLLADLLARRVEIALCPVIDFQLAEPSLKVVPVGGIGCNGPTHTVRVYSRIPLGDIKTVQVDRDSHTSNVLLRIVLNDLLGIRPATVPPPTSGAAGSPEAMLLIGDKVVTAAPSDRDYPYQLDLGEAWKQITGLPFVFAVWTALETTDLGDVPRRLARQRELNAKRIDQIVASRAQAAGWPADLACDYLGHILQYTIGPTELEAIQLFWRRAYELKLIPHLRPLLLDTPDASTPTPHPAALA